MKTRSISAFKYSFRAPGSQVEGPIRFALGRTVLAIAIPCHRVVRSDGSISGYRWGVERRRALLAEESAMALAV